MTELTDLLLHYSKIDRSEVQTKKSLTLLNLLFVSVNILLVVHEFVDHAFKVTIEMNVQLAIEKQQLYLRW